MTIDEILSQLRHIPRRCDFAPYEKALRAAVEQREAITPELIAALDRVSANPALYFGQDADSLHLFAIYLLAEFRETRALDAFIRFFSLSDDDAMHKLTGDMVTENGAALLASVCGGDSAPLLRLVHDESADEFVRGAAIDGLLVQSIWGQRSRPAVIADLRGLFASLPKPGDPLVWGMLVGAVEDFNALELLPEVRQAFAGDLVEESFIALADIDPEAGHEQGGYLRMSSEESFLAFCKRNPPIDTVAECASWLCFGGKDLAPYDFDDDWDDDDEDDWDILDDDDEDDVLEALGLTDTPYLDLPPAPYIAPPKVGRNDPCPCGSGKKYKKCCGK